MKLVILGKPVSSNASYHPRQGGIYMDKDIVVYKDSVGWQAKSQYKGDLLVGRLNVKIDYYFTSERGDHLNSNKALLDALEGIVYKNDRQIKTSQHAHLIDKKNPRIELEITKINK